MPIINNLTGAEIEITKLADILTGTDYDITDVYYGDLHIFTVWNTSEGVLPRTFNANGDNVVDWQVYGETGGVGQRTENLLEPTSERYAFAMQSPNPQGNSLLVTSDHAAMYIIPIDNSSAQTYTTKIYTDDTVGVVRIGFVDSIPLFANQWVYNVSETISASNPTVSSTNGGQRPYLVIQVSGSYVSQYGLANVVVTKSSTAPASFIPYGYEVPMVVKKENLFDKNTAKIGYRISSGSELSNPSMACSTFIPVNIGQIIQLSNTPSSGATPYYFYNGQKQYNDLYSDTNPTTVPENTSYVRVNMDIDKVDELTLYDVTSGSFSPVSLPLYIGSTPLDEGEYTSYADQKIYKYVSGVLTPTDPPVPIPALPTLDGVTVVDTELDSSAVQPEKAVIKYRKENS